ncbi:MAG TPA: hypothetical protein VFB33_08575 [Candidatus Binataceae bacterium]|nr:hypothetical protein [Candidatus Binataceae bacterium]
MRRLYRHDGTAGFWLVYASTVCAALALGACSMLHRAASSGTAAAAPSAAAEGQAADQSEATPPPPGATINLSYTRKGDYLTSLSVTKFSGAEVVETRQMDPRHSISVVRFDGGAPIWEIKADTGVLSDLPGLRSREKFALKAASYGKLPPHFIQVTPENTPPEPLEPGRYYIFAARRASGSVSYEAVRVGAEGELDGYDAEPRAGTSYALCCNVPADFAVPAPPMQGANP